MKIITDIRGVIACSSLVSVNFITNLNLSSMKAVSSHWNSGNVAAIQSIVLDCSDQSKRVRAYSTDDKIQ